MEVTLGQLKERWNSVVWGMDLYKGGDVPLLKIAEEDFESLEVPIGRISVRARQASRRHRLHILVCISS